MCGPDGPEPGHRLEQVRHEPVDAARADAGTAVAEEQRGAGAAAAGGQRGPPALEVGRERPGRGHAERDDALLVALARDPHGERAEVEVVDVGAARLRDAEGGAVEQLDDREVALRLGRTLGSPALEPLEELAHLLAADDARQPALRLRGAQPGAGVGGGMAGAVQPGGQAAGSGGPPREAWRGRAPRCSPPRASRAAARGRGRRRR